MSGTPKQATKNTYIQPPIDGINLITTPTQYSPTEARVLQNYYIYDWGIRERGVETTLFNKAFSAMYGFTDGSGTGKIIGIITQLDPTTPKHVYLMQNPNDMSPVDITGAVDPGFLAGNAYFCSFNKYIFCFSGDLGGNAWQYSIAGGTSPITLISVTGPTTQYLCMGWNYKRRLYMLEGMLGNSTQMWYLPTDSISGTAKSYDFATVLERPGYIQLGFSWGYNQGLQSDELFVLISNVGEILFYSGDSPDAANWALVCRASIPAPTGRKCIVKLGQEVLVSTARGVIPLSHVFAGRGEDAEYYSISRKLGQYGIFQNNQFVIDSSGPFLYGAIVYSPSDRVTSASSYSIFCENYERGAWSQLTVNKPPINLACIGGYLFYSAIYFDPTGTTRLFQTIRIETSGAGETSGNPCTQCNWSTPYLDFGNNLNKGPSFLRALGQDLNTSSNNLVVTCNVASDFSATGGDFASPGGITTSPGNYAIAELSPPGVGRRLSYQFIKTPNGERNELYGYEVTWQEGGLT